jgi:hypothetical protein
MTIHNIALFVIFVSNFWLATSPAEPGPFPETVLENEVLKLHIYLPDSERGYYRGTRFDWSGMIRSAEYKEHTFFGPWRTPHDPTNQEHALGPCEEFGMQQPLGYQEAIAGDTFIKIGVGVLTKLNDEPYKFHGSYEIVQAGEWAVEQAALQGDNWIEFRQALRDEGGWGYEYVKRITLVEASPIFKISHSLKNIGTKTIDTNHYNHNFIRIDDDPIGPGYVLNFPFKVKARRPLAGRVEIVDNELVLRENITYERPLFTEIDGLRGIVEDNGFVLKNIKRGAGIKMVGDRILGKFNLWACDSAISPEPFLHFILSPNETVDWSWTYTFFEF